VKVGKEKALPRTLQTEAESSSSRLSQLRSTALKPPIEIQDTPHISATVQRERNKISLSPDISIFAKSILHFHKQIERSRTSLRSRQQTKRAWRTSLGLSSPQLSIKLAVKRQDNLLADRVVQRDSMSKSLSLDISSISKNIVHFAASGRCGQGSWDSDQITS
jgi:hypothetical protein